MELIRIRRPTPHDSPQATVAWASRTFRGNVAVSSSFQTQSLPLLHIVSRVAPEIPVLFVDTGYHFPETLEFRDRIVREWGLSLRVVRASASRTKLVEDHGEELFRRDPDLCCELRKVEPMRRATRDLEAWISGIRRDQTSARSSIRIVERPVAGPARVHPLADWDSRDVWRYIEEHALLEHPLTAEGYLSIGCAPCTAPATRADDERSGRWVGSGKTECGLHTSLRPDSSRDPDAATG